MQSKEYVCTNVKTETVRRVSQISSLSQNQKFQTYRNSVNSKKFFGEMIKKEFIQESELEKIKGVIFALAEKRELTAKKYDDLTQLLLLLVTDNWQNKSDARTKILSLLENFVASSNLRTRKRICGDFC